MAAAPTNSWCGEDRLSDLPEDVLGIILSYLPTKEAARAAVLRRSWRHSLAAVDAMSFIQDEAHDKNDPSFTAQSQEKRSKNGDFIDEVNAALLCRRRCGAGTAPRAFRVNFGCYTRWDSAMLNRWLYHVLKRSSKVLHLDVRLQHTDLAEHHVKEPYNGEGDGDCDHPRANDPTTDEYALPRCLFSCVVVRTLCLGACTLEPPERIELPFLETLFLSTIRSTGGNIQRLISGCPRLVDLTLERCGCTNKSHNDPLPDKNFTIAVLDKHLRRFSLRCCHNLVRASIDASELRTFEYRGDVPSESLLTLHGAHKISSCTIGFCGRKVYKGELPLLRCFLEQFTGTRHLHLVSTYLGSGIGSEFFSGFPYFPSLVQLELTGYLGGRSVKAATRILEVAPSIVILSLFMKPGYEDRFHTEYFWRQQQELISEPALDVSIPCLRNRLRSINLVHYQGDDRHKYLANLLLCNAMVLEQVCVAFPRGEHKLQTRLKKEIEGWIDW
ncbi:hypothetical protein VPH35_034482 [Triticum aestivum]